MKANVNIKVDTEVRDEAKQIFAQMGLDMTTAVNLFLIAAIREKALPFAVTTYPQLSTDEAIRVLANNLRVAEEQERSGELRSFNEFAAEIKNKYGI